MDVSKFVEMLDSDFYTGVPDSQLKELCNYLIDEYGIDGKHHIIAANEGNCTALAAGYYLATGKIPVIYMQNSGEGNIINPVASLLSGDVYAIPAIFIIGWRGEPGVHDEPQHVYQGKITLELLDVMGIKYFIIDKNTKLNVLKDFLRENKEELEKGRNIAFVVKKGAFQYIKKEKYLNNYEMLRERVIEKIAEYTDDDIVVSTTGKASRELFEIRERQDGGHQRDFLTVGSMGHASSIALEIALQKPQSRVWCMDGDGAMLMHMGSLAVIGKNCPNNFVHVLLNNEAHETVGGMPTVSENVNWLQLASACGYKKVISVERYDELETVLGMAKNIGKLTFIEIKCAVGSREDLGRPTLTALENRNNFMNYLQTKK